MLRHRPRRIKKAKAAEKNRMEGNKLLFGGRLLGQHISHPQSQTTWCTQGGSHTSLCKVHLRTRHLGMDRFVYFDFALAKIMCFVLINFKRIS